MPSFDEFLKDSKIFKNKTKLSASYIPEKLPFREEHISNIMRITAPALKNSYAKNIFIYGLPGTGKTCCAKYIMKEFNQISENAYMDYINCRMYNSKYKILQRLLKNQFPDEVKLGFGITYFYEMLLEYIKKTKKRIVFIFDEIDMVKDLSDLIYLLTRANDELKDQGSISIIGISNEAKVKTKLGQRAKSSLFENELVFSPYNAKQLKSILNQRVKLSFLEEIVDESAINYICAMVSRENGDARFALKLMMKTGEIAEEKNINIITDNEAKLARKSIDEDIAYEIIKTLPESQQLVLYSIADMYSKEKGKTTISGEIIDENENLFGSGDIYLNYEKVCKKFKKKPRTIRQFSEYVNDLELLNLIALLKSGLGKRGRTRLIKLGYSYLIIKKIVKENMENKQEITDYELRFG